MVLEKKSLSQITTALDRIIGSLEVLSEEQMALRNQQMALNSQRNLISHMSEVTKDLETNSVRQNLNPV